METPESPRIWYKKAEFWLKFFAYALPLGFLLYVLYWNFLPFGYDKTFTIQVGSANDTSGQFYLEPSRDLSERKVASDSTTYRELNGLAYAVFQPKAVLKNATVTVSVEGDGVSLTPLELDFDPNSVQWDNSWDFTQTALPKDLIGNAFPFDSCAYFDGKSRLELPVSQDKFETGPFSVYAEWKPEDSVDDFQEIIGHYNWELVQNKDSVSFQVGRMNNDRGPTYSIKYQVSSEFFNQKHSALAIYNPETTNGYLDLYIDGHYAGRSYIGTDTIYPPYNQLKNLTLGESGHGIANHYLGCIYRANIFLNNTVEDTKNIVLNYSGEEQVRVPLISAYIAKLRSVHIYVTQ